MDNIRTHFIQSEATVNVIYSYGDNFSPVYNQGPTCPLFELPIARVISAIPSSFYRFDVIHFAIHPLVNSTVELQQIISHYVLLSRMNQEGFSEKNPRKKAGPQDELMAFYHQPTSVIQGFSPLRKWSQNVQRLKAGLPAPDTHPFVTTDEVRQIYAQREFNLVPKGFLGFIEPDVGEPSEEQLQAAKTYNVLYPGNGYA
ncbi:hypothetical protein F5884DRAFT_756173 [Xylogone sp. PMI_703]|nr:hypothetical protein F5884DRAFT_756173 [Xylogone sp. PMI_703]